MKQLDLFPDMPTILKFKPKKLRECRNCKHILAVKFNNGNIFFCAAQKGGQYGKKIKKSELVNDCPLYIEETEPITHVCGYFGGKFVQGMKR